MRAPHILHHGAVSGVTGSCHQLLMDATNSLLIDCGLFQGAEIYPEGSAGAGNLTIDISLDGIKALVATHVHIDHVGCIPCLLAIGFKGPILCSEPSAKLLPIVLEDAFKLGFSRDQKQVERYPKLIEQRIVALPYKQWLTLIDTPQLTRASVYSVLATSSARPTSKWICTTPRPVRGSGSYFPVTWERHMRHPACAKNALQSRYSGHRKHVRRPSTRRPSQSACATGESARACP